MSDVEELLGLAPLQRGERVRVKVTSECAVCTRNRPRWRRYDGITGAVDSTVPPDDDRWREHRYMVRFDRPATRLERKRRGPALGGAFCRWELERIGAATGGER